jgi:hypothetical protein
MYGLPYIGGMSAPPDALFSALANQNRIHPDLADGALGVLREMHKALAELPPFSGDAAILAEHPGGPGQARCA